MHQEQAAMEYQGRRMPMPRDHATIRLDQHETRMEEMSITLRETKAEFLRMAEMLPAVLGPGLLPRDYGVEGSWTKEKREDIPSNWGIPGVGQLMVGTLGPQPEILLP